MSIFIKIEKKLVMIQEISSNGSFIIIDDDNVTYNLEIEYDFFNQKILMEIYSKFPNIKYEVNYSKEDLINVNEIFSQFKNLDEIYEYILNKFSKQGITIQ